MQLSEVSLNSREQRAKALSLVTTFFGNEWHERLPQYLGKMFSQCFGNLQAVQTSQQAAQEANAILVGVSEQEAAMIAKHIREMSQDGQNVVVRSLYDTPEAHAFFHLIGARMQNIGSVFLFSVPLEHFLAMKGLATGGTPAASSSLTDARVGFNRRMEEILPGG